MASTTRTARVVALLGGALATLAFSFGPNVPAAGAQTDAPAEGLGPLEVLRGSEGFGARTCLRGFKVRGRALTEVENTVSVYVNGQLAQVDEQELEFGLPGIDGTPDSTDPCYDTHHYFGVSVPLTAVESSGVELPAPGEWTSFELTTVLEFEGDSFSSSRTVDLSAGDPFGALASATPTPDGVRLDGWIVDPEFGGPVRYRVTVNGELFPSDTWTNPAPLAEHQAKHSANFPGPAGWGDKELGGSHTIRAVVPFGTICVDALLDAAASVADGFAPIGCLTTISGAVTGKFDSVTPGKDSARFRGNYFNPWIAADEPFPSILLVPDKGRSVSVSTGTRRTTLPASYGELAGWFDFNVNMALPPGRRTVCLRDGSWSSPVFHPDLGSQNRTLGCTVVQVPHMPEGSARITLSGRTITVKGYAVDLNGGKPRVMVADNGVLRGATRVSERNDDAKRLVGGDGYDGYTIRFTVPPGEHQVCVAFEDTSGGGWSQGPCSTLVVK